METVEPLPEASRLLEDAEHEQVAICRDRASGLHAIIALHSTALGPALGGTRFHPYPGVAAALADVLDLSRGMTYKNALAGLDHGGGKAVIIGDPARDRSETLLRAYGRFVQSLGGRYWTACDVGTTVADMDVVARESRFVTGRSEWAGGAGDSSVLTARGVLQGMRAAAEHLWGSPSLAGRTVGVEGVGKVGRNLTTLLAEQGADVVVTDVDEAAVRRVQVQHPQVRAVADTDALIREDLDVYAPCALGGALSAAVADALRAAMVCGGANNQLRHPEVAARLAQRGVLYVPDFVVNAGGVIQVAEEVHGVVQERAAARTDAIAATTARVLAGAAARGVTPVEAAQQLARERIEGVSRLRALWLP